MKYMLAILFAITSFDLCAEDSDLRVDGDRLNATMDRMKTFGGNEAGGSDRVAFSEYNRQAIVYLMELMSQAGLATRIDFAGNLIGSKQGSVDGLASIVSGSHIDTVPNGGHYDGIAGVMAAVEVARTLHDAGITLRHPIEIAAWANEERGKHGSRSLAGYVKPEEMALPAYGGKSIGEGITFLGGDPDRITENARSPDDIASFIEFHVEQGGILDDMGVNVGVVTGIVGIKRWKVTIDGFANHAGSTPMHLRRDPMWAAAQFILAVRRIATYEPGRQVATVGVIEASPGAANVIPGQVRLDLEMRDLSMEKVDMLFARMQREAEGIGTDTGTAFSYEQYYESPPARSDPAIMKMVGDSAKGLGLSYAPMASGAGHDAQSFRELAPLGMIFVPSRDGISHAPDEYTSPQDLTNGANVLLHTLLKMDKAAE